MPQDKKPTTHPDNARISNDIGGDEPQLKAKNNKAGQAQSSVNAGHIAQDATAPKNDLPAERPTEHGGQPGLEPTRYGDWEKKGRCTDF